MTKKDTPGSTTTLTRGDVTTTSGERSRREKERTQKGTEKEDVTKTSASKKLKSSNDNNNSTNKKSASDIKRTTSKTTTETEANTVLGKEKKDLKQPNSPKKDEKLKRRDSLKKNGSSKHVKAPDVPNDKNLKSSSEAKKNDSSKHTRSGRDESKKVENGKKTRRSSVSGSKTLDNEENTEKRLDSKKSSKTASRSSRRERSSKDKKRSSSKKSKPSSSHHRRSERNNSEENLATSVKTREKDKHVSVVDAEGNNRNVKEKKKRTKTGTTTKKSTKEEKRRKRKRRLSIERHKQIQALQPILPSSDEGSDGEKEKDEDALDVTGRGKYRSILNSIMNDHGGFSLSRSERDIVAMEDPSEYESDSSYRSFDSSDDEIETDYGESDSDDELVTQQVPVRFPKKKKSRDYSSSSDRSSASDVVQGNDSERGDGKRKHSRQPNRRSTSKPRRHSSDSAESKLSSSLFNKPRRNSWSAFSELSRKGKMNSSVYEDTTSHTSGADAEAVSGKTIKTDTTTFVANDSIHSLSESKNKNESSSRSGSPAPRSSSSDGDDEILEIEQEGWFFGSGAVLVQEQQQTVIGENNQTMTASTTSTVEHSHVIVHDERGEARILQRRHILPISSATTDKLVRTVSDKDLDTDSPYSDINGSSQEQKLDDAVNPWLFGSGNVPTSMIISNNQQSQQDQQQELNSSCLAGVDDRPPPPSSPPPVAGINAQLDASSVIVGIDNKAITPPTSMIISNNQQNQQNQQQELHSTCEAGIDDRPPPPSSPPPVAGTNSQTDASSVVAVMDNEAIAPPLLHKHDVKAIPYGCILSPVIPGKVDHFARSSNDYDDPTESNTESVASSPVRGSITRFCEGLGGDDRSGVDFIPVFVGSAVAAQNNTTTSTIQEVVSPFMIPDAGEGNEKRPRRRWFRRKRQDANNSARDQNRNSRYRKKDRNRNQKTHVPKMPVS